MEQNVMDLLEEFFKCWLVVLNENNILVLVEVGFDGFCKGLCWILICEKFIKYFELEVSLEELCVFFVEQVCGYFGGG